MRGASYRKAKGPGPDYTRQTERSCDGAGIAMQTTAARAADEAAAEAGGEDAAQAIPAELPDHAYIRTQATGLPSSSCPPMSKLLQQNSCLVRERPQRTPCTLPHMAQLDGMQEHAAAEKLLTA